MYYRLYSGLSQAELYLSLWLVRNSFLSLILHCPNWRQLALLLLLLLLSHCPTVSERVQKPSRITTWFLISILNHPLQNSDELPVSRISTKLNMSNYLEYSGFIPPPFELFIERLLESDWGVLSMGHSVLPIFIACHKLASHHYKYFILELMVWMATYRVWTSLSHLLSWSWEQLPMRA